MDAPWRIRLLGTLEARRGDHVVTRFATSRVAALLARLALFPRRAHPREELIDLLWPDSDADAGRLSLRVALASLRRQLEPPDVSPGSVLVADRSAVRLRPLAFASDVAEFEAALRAAGRAPDLREKREALDHADALYLGELLPGFYDEWVLDERGRLEALCEEARRERDALPACTPAAPDSGPAPEEAPSPSWLGFPIQFTRFFGRAGESVALADRLAGRGARLVTLTGPGGSGKTRLALEAARGAAGAFAGPVCFVPLADLADARFIPEAVAGALGLPRSAAQEPLEQVVAVLAALPPALLVLDNFEHLVERGTPVVFSLLSRLPALTCLVTSRRRLGLPGEREHPVPPLPLPEPDGTPERVAEAASAQLFVDRAQAARPDFQLTPGNAAAVAALCLRLEGSPLAIELVAARAMSLTPAQMTERLASRFELLTSRRWDKGGRHRSLWAAIGWSFDLLPPALRRFFAGLSVFRGGCTVETAEAVCGEPLALEFLTQLRERSLLVIEEAHTGSGSEMRFRLLESLREFGWEHLSPDERRAQGRRHADHFQALAAQMAALWSGPEQRHALEVLDADGDNLRAALAFCRPAPEGAAADGWDGAEVGLRLAGALGDYWTVRGLLREGLDWLEDALAGGGKSPARAPALAQAGWLAAGLGDYNRATTLLSEAVALGRQAGDRLGTAQALRMRGTAGFWSKNFPPAAADLEEALALSRAAGDDRATAAALISLGALVHSWPGDLDRARGCYEEALALCRKCGDRQRASYSLHNLGSMANDDGEIDLAEELLRESLALAESLGDAWQRAYCLRSLGESVEARGDPAGAVLLLEEGIALCRRLGDRMTEAGSLHSLASLQRRQGDPTRAATLLQSALRLLRDLGDTASTAECLVGLAETAASQGHWAHAASLLAAAASAHDASPPGGTHAGFDAAHRLVSGALGPDLFGAAWARGTLLSLDECLAHGPDA